MTPTSHSLRLHPGQYAVVHLPADTDIPSWFVWPGAGLLAMTRTANELSLVTPEEIVPEDTSAERGWRALEVEGPLEFEQIGILSSLVEPLASAGVPVFVISTYLTDYILVKREVLLRALEALRAAGHRVQED